LLIQQPSRNVRPTQAVDCAQDSRTTLGSFPVDSLSIEEAGL
jgi:hypothetical protein